MLQGLAEAFIVSASLFNNKNYQSVIRVDYYR